MIVESTVWVDHFRGTLTPQVVLLLRALPSLEIETVDLVVMEVVRGFRTDLEVRSALRYFAGVQTHRLVLPGLPLQAAHYYRYLRARGITVRSTIDCLIATYCILTGQELLHSDRDFDGFERHLGLKVVHA